MIYLISLLIVCSTLIADTSAGKTDIVEKREVAVVGDRVVLPCVSHQTDSRHKEVEWRYRRTVYARRVKSIWNLKYIVNGYKTRFTVESAAAGQYNLVVYQVQLNDSGFYDCIERGGYGKRHRVQLDVQPSQTITATSATTTTGGKVHTNLVVSTVSLSATTMILALLTFVLTAIIIILCMRRQYRKQEHRKTSELLKDEEKGKTSRKTEKHPAPEQQAWLNNEFDGALDNLEAEIKACNKIRDEIEKSFRNVFEWRRKRQLLKDIDERINGLRRIQTTFEALRPTEDGSLKSDVDVASKPSNLGSSGATPNDYVNDDVIKTMGGMRMPT